MSIKELLHKERRDADERTAEQIEAFAARYSKDMAGTLSEAVDAFDTIAMHILGNRGATIQDKLVFDRGMDAMATLVVMTASAACYCGLSQGSIMKEDYRKVVEEVKQIFSNRFRNTCDSLVKAQQARQRGD
jgi:light-regulated signal transduction histidine kinase (bacteriophytochrome)